MGNAPRLRSLHPIALLVSALVAILCAAPSWGSLPPGRTPRPALVAPADGAKVPERGLQFAWQAAPGARRHFLLISREPFDPASLRALPAAGAIEVHEVPRPIVALEGLGIRLEHDTRLFWAAAGIDPGNGRFDASELRSCSVLRRFSNRVEPSPYLEASPIARATPETRGPASPRRIRLSAGYEIDPAAGAALVPEALRAPAGPGSGRRTVLAYFGDEDPEVARERILAAGGLIVGYIPDRTYVVRFGSGTSNALEGVVAWSDAYHPAYKLSRRLGAESSEARLVNLRVFPDGDLDAVAAAVAAKGGEVRMRSDNGINKILHVSIAGSAISGLAAEPDVAWIEPHVPFRFNNTNAQWATQTAVSNNRRIHDLGLRGEGQVIMTSDSGVEVTHDQFRDPAVPLTTFGEYPTHRKVIAYQRGGTSPAIAFGDQFSVSYHGTHTACTALGLDDPVATTNSPQDGMAKAAKLWFMDLSGPTLDGLDVFLDLNDLFQPSYTGNAGGQARVSSNSWGAPIGGDYDLSGLTADQFVWNHPDYLVCFATGNSSSPGSVGTPATAKNVVSVGGTGNGSAANQIYGGTSRGPTADGRRKPVVAAPGNLVVSARTGTLYQPLSGTSMASPGVAGNAALLRQYLVEGWYPTGAKVPANGFTPSAALLKAMLVNSAANTVTGYVAPDNNIGYGRIIDDDVLYFAGDARRLLLVDQTAGIGNQQYIDYQVNVTNASVPLEVTLCWNDYPGDPAGTSQIRNDLNLQVTKGALVYRGNSYTGGSSNTNPVVDDVNVEEAVLIPAPAAGVWTIRVLGTFVPFGPQPFAVCITGGVGNDAGSVALDRASYGSASTVEIEVTDVNAGPAVNVHVASSSEPAGETVALTGGTGRFSGTIALSPSIGATGDGTLQVSNGDQITATYTDASPAATLIATATVVIGQPLIAEVAAESQGAGTALVSWETDVNSTSRVYYGLTPALGSSTTLDPLAVTLHQVAIAGLTAGATYYFDVESRDLNGSVTRDDNGGQHYRFTVRTPGDILLVYSGDEFEHADRYTAAFDSLGWAYDVWKGPLSETPVVGSLAGGLRSYRAVWWQVGLEYYPPFTDAARDSITAYLNGGGRLAVVGHDIAWALGDGASPYYSAARDLWLQNTLHTLWVLDPPTWPIVYGVAGDPISDSYAGGVPYEETRLGASGDEVDLLAGAGTITGAWKSGDGTPYDCGFRWESAAPLGTPGSGVWGGSPSRLASLYFEWSRVDFSLAISSRRQDILDKGLAWLLGRRKPEVTLNQPNGGTITTDATTIAWDEAVFGAPVASRSIEWSGDGGQSWALITASAGPSPYLWDLTAVPNTGQALVRVRVTDGGSPALSGFDQSEATFALQRAAGDLIGPVVRAGSIQLDPNPVDNQQAATLTAVVSDSASGGSTVTAAEWSVGSSPAPAGSGTPIVSGLGSITAQVSGTIPAATLPAGTQRIHVRGRDQAGNWGPASQVEVTVNDPATSALLSLFEASAVAEGIEVRWRFSRPLGFETLGVERADGLAGPWTALEGALETRGDVSVFLDATAVSGHTYAYRVAVRTGGETQTFGPIWATAGRAISRFEIEPISPNPTRGPARIDFAVAREVRVRLVVLDLQGREVATLVDRPLGPGRFQAVWNGTDGTRLVSSGVYFVRMEWPGQSAVRRVVVTH